MRIDILTLFPGMFKPFLEESIIKRAILGGKVSVNVIDIRSFSTLNNNQVDDTPYGGGAGMVLMCDPVFRAVESVKSEKSHVVLLSPSGKTYNQKVAKEFKNYEHLILLCGHYEGFDERIKTIIDEEISIGDFVLTGGEVPAMAISDSIIRLLPGVISADSLESESFEDSLLDYPVYTKPQVYRGMKVPDVLVSGDHKKIDEYRESERLRITREKRPDLLK
ncbi:MAG: tRNA (guanosine(37)-N1)-methyltransferase TrmD [Tenericutes bacterium]|nr:tRNA (guanosine(37)-N1)-methyltransferase TrmD [Mycoplasmatota bacterium]